MAAPAGLIAGIVVGLLVAWVVWPVEFKNAEPADLRQSLKEDYVRMVSVAYEADGDLAAAKQRLTPLQLSNPAQTFTDLIEQERKKADDSLTQDALIHLGQALGYPLPYTALRPPPTPRGTLNSITVVATPAVNVPTFKLVGHTQLTCADEPDAAYLRFIVRDAAGQGVPNIAIDVRGGDMNETIYTGLKPERGSGYADLEAAPGTYSVTLLNAQSETISNLVIGDAPADCKADKGTTPRGWRLVFQQQ